MKALEVPGTESCGETDSKSCGEKCELAMGRAIGK